MIIFKICKRVSKKRNETHNAHNAVSLIQHSDHCRHKIIFETNVFDIFLHLFLMVIKLITHAVVLIYCNKNVFVKWQINQFTSI